MQRAYPAMVKPDTLFSSKRKAGVFFDRPYRPWAISARIDSVDL